MPFLTEPPPLNVENVDQDAVSSIVPARFLSLHDVLVTVMEKSLRVSANASHKLSSTINKGDKRGKMPFALIGLEKRQSDGSGTLDRQVRERFITCDR
jgi:hypothetical protein